ncbi:MAG: long-chain acyl-CoA synthetase [Pseudohongiellaceae bacterium]|jgi:long-chain acyl-CoA synthetase
MRPHLLAQLNELESDKDAIILRDLERQYTLEQVNNLCDGLEKILLQEKISLLALHAENGPLWVVADLVCQRMNICLVPLPTFFSPLQLQAVLGHCQVEFLLTDNPESLHALVERTDKLLEMKSALQLCKVKEQFDVAPSSPKNTGKITFTSGSTGVAKGVCLSNEQLLTQATALKEVVGLMSPRHLCLLPLSTLLENVAGVYAPLLARGEVILPTLSDMGYQGSRLVAPEKMLGLIQQIAPDTIILIPELLKLLVTAAKTGWSVPESFKFIAVGGSKVGKALLQEAWSYGLPVYEGYGLSECASVVSLNTPADRLDGSCGKPLPHVGLKVLDGEIVVTGNTMLGYMNNPETWYQAAIHTGDLGHQDEAGFVHLDGRKKNILISSYGRNISPEWPESELLANPLLQDVVVFGDARPHCVALISCRDPQCQNELIQQWIDQVNGALPDYAQVKSWYRLPQVLAAHPGLLTQNGRPRREEIARGFACEIDALYEINKSETVTSDGVSTKKEVML